MCSYSKAAKEKPGKLRKYTSIQVGVICLYVGQVTHKINLNCLGKKAKYRLKYNSNCIYMDLNPLVSTNAGGVSG